jgi:phosphopantothenoylcysteine synthetase/decarboxylase
MTTRVLYVIVCGSPIARGVGKLIALAQQDGWDVCLLSTPDGRKFLDVPALATQTGHPVRWRFKNPGEPDLLPDADAMIVAPATFNTVAKWAAGITDTLPLALLIEGQGKGLPIVAMPFTNLMMARHPAFLESITRLRGWGIAVLYGQDVVPLVPAGQGEAAVDGFPWQLALDALRDVAPLTHR